MDHSENGNDQPQAEVQFRMCRHHRDHIVEIGVDPLALQLRKCPAACDAQVSPVHICQGDDTVQGVVSEDDHHEEHDEESCTQLKGQLRISADG